MKGNGDDLGFIVVPNPKAGKFNWFDWYYPRWYKIKRFPCRLLMLYQSARRKRVKLIFER